MLVGYFFFFNPLPYLSFTPPLNLKAQFSANWKSLFLSPSSLIYGGYGVGAKCTTHRPVPYALKSLSYPPPFPFLPTPFLAERSLSLSVTLRTYCTGETAPIRTWLHSWFLLFSSALFLVLFFLVGCG